MNTKSTGSEPYDQDRPDVLTWLMGWYLVHCNGDWEHTYGVKIDTLDNPGWALRIDLTDTELDGLPFERSEVHRSEDDWLVAWLENGQWQLACGPLNLSEGLHRFRAWASAVGSAERPDP